MNPDRYSIVDLIENNGVELRIQNGQLIGRWRAGGQMPEGAAMFIRRFKPEIVAVLQERDDALGDQDWRNRLEDVA